MNQSHLSNKMQSELLKPTTNHTFPGQVSCSAYDQYCTQLFCCCCFFTCAFQVWKRCRIDRNQHMWQTSRI